VSDPTHRASDADLPSEVDAIVIGAGPNGLVAANRLADAGWQVLVLEAQPDVGGAVKSDRDVHPDFIHDTFSAFYPMAAVSPAIQALTLESYGLRWRHAPAVVGHPRPDGDWALLHRDVDITAQALNDDHAGDGDAWRALTRQWERIGPALLESFLTPFPPVRGGLRTLARLPGVGGLSFVRTLLSPAAHQLSSVFGGTSARMLLAGNAAHADIPLDGAGSGLMGLMLCMLAQTVGFPVPEGGAGALSGAMYRRLIDRGGQVRCRRTATAVLIRRGRAVGVVADGETVRCRRAVLADVDATHLYGNLVPWDLLPGRLRQQMRSFRHDPSTFKVDFAMSGPIPWAVPPAYAPGTVHIADSMEELTTFYGQLAAGTVPDRPFLLVGQMTTSDPGRSPSGTESVWAYTHVPQQVRADAGGQVTGRWDAADAERFADRMQARLEHHAPGFGSRILARRILTPGDLERRDANLVGGALNGGTANLDQQVIFRPVPGLGRASTPIRGLYLASASAHPGGSVHGACGMNAARAALAHARLFGSDDGRR
jgi:phytoene dehydrogenase-like protein